MAHGCRQCAAMTGLIPFVWCNWTNGMLSTTTHIGGSESCGCTVISSGAAHRRWSKASPWTSETYYVVHIMWIKLWVPCKYQHVSASLSSCPLDSPSTAPNYTPRWPEPCSTLLWNIVLLWGVHGRATSAQSANGRAELSRSSQEQGSQRLWYYSTKEIIP